MVIRDEHGFRWADLGTGAKYHTVVRLEYEPYGFDFWTLKHNRRFKNKKEIRNALKKMFKTIDENDIIEHTGGEYQKMKDFKVVDQVKDLDKKKLYFLQLRQKNPQLSASRLNQMVKQRFGSGIRKADYLLLYRQRK